jgi:hypothetical protein
LLHHRVLLLLLLLREVLTLRGREARDRPRSHPLTRLRRREVHLLRVLVLVVVLVLLRHHHPLRVLLLLLLLRRRRRRRRATRVRLRAVLYKRTSGWS